MTAVNHVDTVTQWHSNASEEIPGQINEQFCKQDIPKQEKEQQMEVLNVHLNVSITMTYPHLI